MDLRNLAPAGVMLVVTALVLGLGADILSDMQASACGNQTAGIGEAGYCGWQIYGNGTAAVGEVSKWLPTIALVIAASVIIGTIIAFFYFRNEEEETA